MLTSEQHTRDADGQCWRLQLDETGNLYALTCEEHPPLKEMLALIASSNEDDYYGDTTE